MGDGARRIHARAGCPSSFGGAAEHGRACRSASRAAPCIDGAAILGDAARSTSGEWAESMDDVGKDTHSKMPPEDGDAFDVFDMPVDEEEEARLDALADAEIDAGLFVTHERVVEWLESLRTPNPLPRPKPEPR